MAVEAPTPGFESAEEERDWLREILADITRPVEAREIGGVRLTRLQARLAGYLQRRGSAEIGQIMEALYWDRDPPTDKNVSVQVFKINRAFEDAGLPRPISNSWGGIYRWSGP